MYVEFENEEKELLIKAGFTEEENHKFIHSDPNFTEFYLELKKFPDNTVEVTVNFSDGDVEKVPFSNLHSFLNITEITFGEKNV